MWKGPAFLWCPAHCLHYWLEECGGWGEMELPLSVSVCVCVCACACAQACLSVCLSPMGLWRPAKGRDGSKGPMKQHGHVGWGAFPASPTSVPFWGKNG